MAGRILLTVPHMDDGVLACGGTIAQLSDPSRVHVVYASDGRGSPEPVVPWQDRVTDDLFEVRRAEAIAAMSHLGVPKDQLHFLELPDRRLRHHSAKLGAELKALIARLAPDRILAPFRFDQNPDHLALHAAARACAPRFLIEYFVYYRLRFLPGGDLRDYLQPALRSEVDIRTVSQAKRAALDCFASQTTRFYPWQTRPNLTATLLDDVSAAPENFVCNAPAGGGIFFRSATRIRMLNRLEPMLKRPKDRAIALLRRGLSRNV
ncbi:MAG: PIG-L family deacetylase [Deltaproteobacteria bacterium]|nr:PIG-L family deacetylase [Deltaproteobacteria bacterium]MBW2541932.1 PIG-L family deacetylase [Deltaproteobacteria bacterium]